MLNNIKNSILKQIKYLFLLSFLAVISLWIFFYLQQKHQNEEHQIARYFSIISSLQPLIMESYDFKDNELKGFNMKLYPNKDVKNKKLLFQKGGNKKGFEVYKIGQKIVIYIYNPMGELYLEDLQENGNYIFIHLVFILLLMIQFLLYFMLQKSLKPLQIIHNKLKNLQSGDMSLLEYSSNYDEINQIIISYNSSISQIEYLLETREMFNKIFIHEMKMPIAKGMFYLKLEPSYEVNEKMTKLMQRLNSELDEFAILESLIVHKDKIEQKEHNLLELLNSAIEKVGIEKKENINIIVDENYKIFGDSELWIICFKNLLDNALKYSTDNQVIVDCSDNGIRFINQGEKLPIAILSDLRSWKIDKTKRHKSSTGYGFGLFIIKNIVNLNGYFVEYHYENNNNILGIKKCIMH